MKKTIFILTSLIAVSFAACQKNVEEEITEMPEDNTAEVINPEVTPGSILHAVVGNETDTKVSANAIGTYTWQTSDKIAVLDNNGDAFEFTASSAGTSVDFTSSSSITFGDYAAYPYSASFAASGDYVEFFIPSTIEYSADATNMPMLGRISEGAATFRAVGGLLKLIVYGVPSDATSLEFSAKAQKISGGFDIDDASKADAKIVTTTKGTGDNIITIDFTGKRSENMVFYIPLPTGTIEGFDLTFDDSELTSKSSSKNLTVSRNDIIIAPTLNLTVVPDASLTNSEITSAVGNSYNASETKTITSASGTWTYLNACVQLSLYQMKSAGYLQLPTFSNNISEIVLNSVQGTSGGFTGTIYFSKTNSTAAAQVITSKACSGTNGNVSLTVPAGYKTGYIKYSATGRLASVTVKFSGVSSTPSIDLSPVSPSRTIGVGSNTASDVTGITLSNPLDGTGIAVETSESWLEATLTGSTLSISSNSYNHSETDRIGYVYLKATGAEKRTVTVTQKPSLVSSPTLSSEAGDKTFTVSWAPDEKADSYVAYYSTTDNLENPDVAGTALTIDDSSTPYTVSPVVDLANGTPYYIYVKVATVGSSYSSIYAPSSVWAKISVTPTAGGGELPKPETITFSSLSLSNATQYTSIGKGTSYANDKNFTISFAGGDNDGKYYNTGSGIRTYASDSGNITVSSSYYISKIEFTFSTDGYAPSDGNYTVDTGSLTTGAGATWTGKSKSVIITNKAGSGHWRLQALTVTYTE